MRVLSHGLNECFYPVAIVTCNNNVTTVHIVPDQLMWNKKAKNCTVWTTRICIYQLTLVLCTVSVAREPKSNVLVFIFRKYASIRGLTENWRIYRLFSGIRRKYNSLVCLHEFITLYCCMLQYFHCNFVYIVFHVPIRLNPEKIFEELQACPKEVCVIYFFRLVCAIRPWWRYVWWIWLFLFSLVHQTSSGGIPPCHAEAYHT